MMKQGGDNVKRPAKRVIVMAAGISLLPPVILYLYFAIIGGTYHGRSIRYHLFIKAGLIKEFPIVSPVSEVSYTNDFGDGMGPLNDINYDSSASLDELIQKIDQFIAERGYVPQEHNRLTERDADLSYSNKSTGAWISVRLESRVGRIHVTAFQPEQFK